MKLSTLIPHTSRWTGVPETQVRTVAYELRPVGLISSGGRGPGGAEMTTDDKVNLFLGACGVTVAKRAAEYVRAWHLAKPTEREGDTHGFAFMAAENVPDLIVGIVQDLASGRHKAWVPEKKLYETAVMLDFYVDECALEMSVSGRITLSRHPAQVRMSRRFEAPPPLPRHVERFDATSQVIRRLNEANMIGWGACLRDA
jgi:hypothetical protein